MVKHLSQPFIASPASPQLQLSLSACLRNPRGKVVSMATLHPLEVTFSPHETWSGDTIAFCSLSPRRQLGDRGRREKGLREEALLCVQCPHSAWQEAQPACP